MLERCSAVNNRCPPPHRHKAAPFMSCTMRWRHCAESEPAYIDRIRLDVRPRSPTVVNSATVTSKHVSAYKMMPISRYEYKHNFVDSFKKKPIYLPKQKNMSKLRFLHYLWTKNLTIVFFFFFKRKWRAIFNLNLPAFIGSEHERRSSKKSRQIIYLIEIFKTGRKSGTLEPIFRCSSPDPLGHD